MVAKMFVACVRYPIYQHPNDFDFRFSQRCGYNRKILKAAGEVSVDLDVIDAQVQQLLNYDKANSYVKQKDSLQKELEGFLSALPSYVTLATVTPRDLCRFLVYKEKHGKTWVHRNSCSFMGQRGKHPCGCPIRLSYKTVDSYIGKLRTIFQANGRDGEWDRQVGLGNPAADKLVKDYLRLITAEQLQARVTPKQAILFFVDKVTRLTEHLQRSLGNAKSNIKRFVEAHDQAYLKAGFFSGDRPGDLGQVKTPESQRFPNDDGDILIPQAIPSHCNRSPRAKNT